MSSLPARNDASASCVPTSAPRGALVYLAHTSEGISIRALSRRLGVHPSTVHRQVRRVEERRDDPLYDEAICRLDQSLYTGDRLAMLKEHSDMLACRSAEPDSFESRVEKEARRILRRLSEPKSFLAVAPEAKLAVVFRESVPGRPRQIATIEREVAKEFALRDWIACRRTGKVACYELTTAGRAALERMLAEDVQRRRATHGFAEARTPFQAQHQIDGSRLLREQEEKPRRVRVNLAESPLAWLASRAGPDGTPFLTRRELESGERLREDFERAELGPNVTQNWQRFLTAGTSGGRMDGGSDGAGPARDRVSRALKELGPGLSDIVFRCCCFLEGLETAEKRLGWSKRSGKVVLKIALGRLADHYESS